MPGKEIGKEHKRKGFSQENPGFKEEALNRIRHNKANKAATFPVSLQGGNLANKARRDVEANKAERRVRK